MKRKLARLRLRTVRDPAALLERHLAALLGDSSLARTVLGKALVRANLDDVPEHPEALLALCSTHLLAVLPPALESAEVVIFLRDLLRNVEDAYGSPVDFESVPAPDARSDDCAKKSEAPSGPRGSGEGLRLILVDEDAAARAAIARVLVRTGATVLVATGALDGVLTSDFAGAHILVCNLDAERSVFALLEITEQLPTLAVVARAQAADLGEVTLKLAGAKRYRILSSRPRETEIVASVLTLWRVVCNEGTER